MFHSGRKCAVLLLSVCLLQVAGAFDCESEVNCTECADGCLIPDSYLSDGFCDCVDCGDEDLFTCDSCNGCPTVCGDSIQCHQFNCTNGCQIAGSKVDDGNCDCGDCVDENALSCDTCANGCPESCGAFTLCAWQSSTVSPNGTESESGKGDASDSYQCVDVSDLAPWWWVATAVFWHVLKSLYFIGTAEESYYHQSRSGRTDSISEKIQKYTDDKYMALPKVIFLLSEMATYIVVFVLECLRFHRKHTDGLNGWQQYSCFAEIWMFSSNAPRLFAILIASMCLFYANKDLRHAQCQECIVSYSGYPLGFLLLLICPTFVLYISIFVTHILPMCVVYCWVLLPGICLLLGCVIVFLLDESQSGLENKLLRTYMTILLGLLCATVLFTFTAALAFNFYRTGRYWHSLKVVLYERSYKDYLTTVPMGSSFLKMAIWLF